MAKVVSTRGFIVQLWDRNLIGQVFCDDTNNNKFETTIDFCQNNQDVTAARIEQGSSLMLAEESAIYAVGAFLCSCFHLQVMSNYTAIEKKFQ